jgi:hypothetical protein
MSDLVIAHALTPSASWIWRSNFEIIAASEAVVAKELSEVTLTIHAGRARPLSSATAALADPALHGWEITDVRAQKRL